VYRKIITRKCIVLTGRSNLWQAERFILLTTEVLSTQLIKIIENSLNIIRFCKSFFIILCPKYGAIDSFKHYANQTSAVE